MKRRGDLFQGGAAPVRDSECGSDVGTAFSEEFATLARLTGALPSPAQAWKPPSSIFETSRRQALFIVRSCTHSLAVPFGLRIVHTTYITLSRSSHYTRPTPPFPGLSATRIQISPFMAVASRSNFIPQFPQTAILPGFSVENGQGFFFGRWQLAPATRDINKCTHGTGSAGVSHPPQWK